MTDFAPEGAVDAAPTGEAPAETLPDQPVNWEEKYRAEVQDRIKERERYKPFQQTIGRLHPDDAKAINEFVSAFASGDTDTATRWMVDNARSLAGDKWETLISPAQQAAVTNAVTSQAVTDGQSAGMTPQQIEQLVQERLNDTFQQIQEQQVRAQYEQQIESTLAEHGLEPDSPLATAAIVAATKRTDLDLGAAIRDMEDQVLAQAQAIANRRAQAGQQMGSPVVNGVSAVSNVGQSMSPRDRALARLQANGL